MFSFRKDKGHINIDIDYDSLTKSAIPLLIEDESWMKLFEHIKEQDIIDIKENLTELVKENRTSKKELALNKAKKNKIIAKILTLSDKINNEDLTEGVELLDEYQEQLHKINDEIEELAFKTETLPGDIRECNLGLLKATVKYSYKELTITEKNLKYLNKELMELRERLKTIITEKYDYEERRNKTYAFLHSVLGGKEVDRLDENILKNIRNES